MMRTLALESSRRQTQLALAEDGVCVASRSLEASGRLEEALRPAVEGMLEERGLGIEALEALAVGIGPGSFTGLRIGLGFARVLAWTRQIPVTGVSGMLALAELAGAPAGEVLVLEDDHPRGLYAARVATEGEVPRLVVPIEHTDLAQAAAELPAGMPAIGSATERLGEELAALGLRPLTEPAGAARAEALASLAHRLFLRGERQDARELAPLYVQPLTIQQRAR